MIPCPLGKGPLKSIARFPIEDGRLRHRDECGIIGRYWFRFTHPKRFQRRRLNCGNPDKHWQSAKHKRDDKER